MSDYFGDTGPTPQERIQKLNDSLKNGKIDISGLRALEKEIAIGLLKKLDPDKNEPDPKLVEEFKTKLVDGRAQRELENVLKNGLGNNFPYAVAAENLIWMSKTIHNLTEFQNEKGVIDLKKYAENHGLNEQQLVDMKQSIQRRLDNTAIGLQIKNLSEDLVFVVWANTIDEKLKDIPGFSGDRVKMFSDAYQRLQTQLEKEKPVAQPVETSPEKAPNKKTADAEPSASNFKLGETGILSEIFKKLQNPQDTGVIAKLDAPENIVKLPPPGFAA